MQHRCWGLRNSVTGCTGCSVAGTPWIHHCRNCRKFYKWIPQFQLWIHHLCNSSAADLLGSVEDGWVSWTMSHYFQRLNLTNYKLRFASTLSSTNFDILSPTVHSSSTDPSHFEFWFLSNYLIIEGSCVRVAGCASDQSARSATDRPRWAAAASAVPLTPTIKFSNCRVHINFI